MSVFTDSLRGYAFVVHKRDNFRCRYCGADGTKSFETWLTLTWDHLLPKGHRNRDKEDYIMTACNFCNTADNRYFEQAEKRGLKLDKRSPGQLLMQRLRYIKKTRQSYQEFWKKNVYKKKGILNACMGR